MEARQLLRDRCWYQKQEHEPLIASLDGSNVQSAAIGAELGSTNGLGIRCGPPLTLTSKEPIGAWWSTDVDNLMTHDRAAGEGEIGEGRLPAQLAGRQVQGA